MEKLGLVHVTVWAVEYIIPQKPSMLSKVYLLCEAPVTTITAL